MNEDVFKLIVICLAATYFWITTRKRMATTNRFLVGAGLLFLFCASFLDFADGIKAFENTPILGRSDPWHDILEDQVFDAPGFILLFLGAFREMGSNES